MREHNERMQLAWVTARLSAYPPSKPRDFTKLEKLMATDEKKPSPRQTWEQQFHIAKLWTAALAQRS